MYHGFRGIKIYKVVLYLITFLCYSSTLFANQTGDKRSCVVLYRKFSHIKWTLKLLMYWTSIVCLKETQIEPNESFYEHSRRSLNIRKSDGALLEMLANKVVINIHMFCPLVKNWIVSHYTTFVRVTNSHVLVSLGSPILLSLDIVVGLHLVMYQSLINWFVWFFAT